MAGLCDGLNSIRWVSPSRRPFSIGRVSPRCPEFPARMRAGGSAWCECFVRHKVNDYTVWRKAYDAFETERPGFGVTGHAVFYTVGDPNDVTAWHDFDTIEAARSFANSAQLKEVMQAAGVHATRIATCGESADARALRRRPLEQDDGAMNKEWSST